MLLADANGFFVGGVNAIAEDLQRFRVRPLDIVIHDLGVTHTLQSALIVLGQAGLCQGEEFKTLRNVFSMEERFNTAMNRLQAEVPLLDIDSGEELYLYPEPLGMNAYIWDDAWQNFEESDMSLEVFLLGMIGHFFEDFDESEFDANTRRFHWPFTSSPFPDMELDWYEFDDQAAKAYLHGVGVDVLAAAIDYALCFPDNVYFNTPADDLEGLEFTVESINLLRADYAKAKPLLEAYGEACSQVQRDPGLLTVLVNAIKAGFRQQEEVRSQ